MYNIVFIDEAQEDVDNFLDYIEGFNISERLSVKTLPPLPIVEDLVEQIFEHRFDAVIVDFRLNELRDLIDYNVPYNGVELVEEILDHREGFPCFVITHFDDDAIKSSHDVNVVYQKDILYGSEKKTEQKASFVDRIIQQIGHYKSRLTGAEERFNELITQSRANQLNADEENELKELDSFLERASFKHGVIPDSLKDASIKENIHKLIANTDKLLEKLDGK